MGAFKICVPLFTFLVGYGYAFAKQKDLKHGLKRSWHLLSHFWLILLGLFLPVAIWAGDYTPTISNVLVNMFGLESNLNWYSWYIYFYIYAMLIMIPVSQIINRFGILGVGGMIILSYGITSVIHLINGWQDNIWLQAIQDCFLCSPVMYSGYWLASSKAVQKIKIPHNVLMGFGLVILAVILFLVRKIQYVGFLDFIIVPIFCLTIVMLFDIIKWQPLIKGLIGLGKESMNIWFFHAIFATAVTAVVFAPLIDWIQPKALLIIMMIIASYFAGRLFTGIYKILK